MRLLQTGGGDPNEGTALLELRNRRCSGVEHGLAQAADELIGNRGQRSTVRDMALDALRDQHRIGGDVALEVAIPGIGGAGATTGGHGAERSHSAIRLELLAIDEDELTRALLTAGQQRAEHHRVGAGHQRLGDVTGVLQATVTDQRHTCRPAGQRGIVDRRYLRNSDTGYHARSADGARPDSDLDAVYPSLDKRLGSGVRGDRKSTRLNSSHANISYAVFCLKKKNKNIYKYIKILKKKHKFYEYIVSNKT